MNGLLIRELYSGETLDRASDRLETSPQTPEDIDELFGQTGIDKRILTRTVQKGMEEYVDGLVDLRHGWKPKMMDGSPKEKAELYDGLHATIKRMDEFSEPYVSSMRLISNVALRQLAGTTSHTSVRQGIEEALTYEGIFYDFDEQSVTVTPVDSRPVTTRTNPVSVDGAYSQITDGFTHLKDLLNLVEDATSPEVYDNVRNTNEFPEARIGKCFEAAHEIDRALRQVMGGYEFLLKKADLSTTDKRRINETLKLLKGLDRSKLTRATQWYAALQFNEKPWSAAYWLSIGATGAGIFGAAYSLAGGTNATGLFLASATWAIISGASIYTFTDAGPKTAKQLRKLDECVIRYRRV